MSPPSPDRAVPKPPPLPRPSTLAGRSDWVFRAVIVTVLCASAALAWWSLKVKLLPLQKQSRELTVTVSHLSTEVDTLDRAWPKTQQEEVARRLARAHGQLFGNQAALEAWLTQVKQQAGPLLLEARTDLGQSISKVKGEEEVAVIPTTISVDVRPGQHGVLKDSAYERLLRLTQHLAEVEKRADLAEVDISGGTNSVGSARLVFHLWAGEGGRL